MRMRSTLSLVTIFVLAISGVDSFAQETDLEHMQGDWEIISVQEDGEEEDLPEGRINIEGNCFSFIPNEGDDRHILYFNLEVENMPPHINIHEEGDDPIEDIGLGIYQLEGDQLTICVSEPRGPGRPDSFESSEGVSLIVLRRMIEEE